MGAGPEAIWRGMATVAGSWIGSSANQHALYEICCAGPDVFSIWIAVDVIVANVWMAGVLWIAANQVRVYTVAFGADVQRGPFGMMLPAADMDEGTLRAIAEQTGGRFFRARDTAELAGIYAEMDRLEQTELSSEPVRPRRELYPWPAAAALVLAMASLLAAARGARRSAAA